MSRPKRERKTRKPHPKPKGQMYDFRLIAEQIQLRGGFYQMEEAWGISHSSLRSAARGENITMATFWTLVYALNVTGCELLGGPCKCRQG